ncbi:NAD(P)-dependent oxidoreductase [Capnocytophaga stomatis]|uniref:epimerase n=1 Tax=Capnocytophaga stomatis TaxID=1848904 RepID=UPI0019522A68|nr:epimerase [Capnocytophaga stomatis]GIJ93131.1 NAD(P)-dependent oxidoreductase [Capnocytophaga stomatis]
MKIGIIGCGWLGFRLAKHLKTNNTIYTTARNIEKYKSLDAYFRSFLIDFDDFEVKKWKILSDLDCIIITIPFGRHLNNDILEKRLENICFFIQDFKKQLFFTSSVGIYPQSDTEMNEYFPSTLLEPKLFFVESFLRNQFPQINILRLGGLMGDDRILSKYKISEPNQVANHIHYQDICLIIEKMISLNLESRLYNVVAPQHPMKQEIINYQKGTKTTLGKPYGKIILSEKLETELDYNFLYPNPIYFT